jgi:hypothetical protein
MARDGSGTYTRVSNSFTGPIAGSPISATDADAFWDELESEMTDSLSRSGKGGMSADLDMNNNDINEIKTAVFQGSTSGNTTVVATAIAGTTTLTLPAATDTLVGKATTDTLTNKTLVAPALGTPVSGVATNLTGTASGLTAGNVTTNANLTGAVTSTGNATSLGSFSSANLASALTDETGTGASVFATSPTITTPNVVGVTNASAASAGSVGELITNEVTFASRFSITSNTLTTITTISVTAGDWDVSGVAGFETSGGGVASEYHIEISTTAPPTIVTAPNAGGTVGIHITCVANQGQAFAAGPRQVNVSGTTTVYLKCLSTFTNSQTAYGYLRARRIR